MSKKRFKSPCERMRFRALRDGDGSEADLTWRRHASTCPECKATLYLLNLLSSQGTPKESLEISPDDKQTLVDMASRRYAPRRPMGRLFGSMLWKVGLVASVILVATQFIHVEPWLNRGLYSLTSRQMAAARQVHQDRPALTECQQAFLAAPTPAAAAAMPEIVPGNELDGAILELQDRIDEQYQDLEDLIDNDLTGY